MKIREELSALLFVLSLVGCGRQPETSAKHLVILVDVSGSIDRSALEQALRAVDKLAAKLHRGDKLAVIPIFGDAKAEASGKIIRFEIQHKRQAYDSDLRDFRMKLVESLIRLRSAAIAHPGIKTDILGSTILAKQEFNADSVRSRDFLVIFSDFIEDDGSLDFKLDKRLNNTLAVKELAIQIAKKDTALSGVRVFLELQKSVEIKGLSRTRRKSIQSFWIEYFKACGAEPAFEIDGPLLIDVVNLYFFIVSITTAGA